MEEVSVESVRAAVQDVNPVQEAMAILMKNVAFEAVGSLAGVLSLLGQKPEDISGIFIVQATLVESERVFATISREDWIKVFDTYHAVKAIIDANSDIKESLDRHEAQVNEAFNDFEALLDGGF
jgi:hypothetical protein